MIRIERLKVGPEEQENYKRFSSLAKESARCCLLGKDPFGISTAQVLALGGFEDSYPVALILASIQPVTYFVEIHSLFVDPAFRNRSLAHQLLSQLERELPRGPTYQLILVYPLGDSSTPAVEKILSDLHWSGKRPFMTCCRFESALFHPPWIDLEIAYPEGVEEFLWKDLSAEDLEDLRHQQRQQLFPAALSPFQEKDRIEPLNSLGLRCKGRVIGWCLTHRIATDTIRYSFFFINRNFRRGRYGMKLLIDAIWLQKRSSVKWAVIEVPLLLVDAAWVHLVEKHLVPYAESVSRRMQAWKQIKGS